MHSLRQWLSSALVVLAITSPAAAQTATPAPELARLLEGDPFPPAFGVKYLDGVRREGDVTVQEITFPSVSGGAPIEAYLVRPASAEGSFAGVLFVHWFGPPAPTSNRTQFLDEAKALA